MQAVVFPNSLAGLFAPWHRVTARSEAPRIYASAWMSSLLAYVMFGSRSDRKSGSSLSTIRRAERYVPAMHNAARQAKDGPIQVGARVVYVERSYHRGDVGKL